jgi:hypothetical protein
MSTTNQTKNTTNASEEVDLGSLFLIIGKGFARFFNFIGSIFTGFFHLIIKMLIFLRKNIVKIGVAAIIGGVVGVFLESKKIDTFESELLLEPNFNSTRQLYDNVNYYNNLVKQKDTAELEKIFKLDKLSAASLKKFIIEPFENQNDIINSYNSFVLAVDTTTVKSYTFKDFQKEFTDYDYKFHTVRVIAEKNNVFDKLDEVIISSVVKNKYFNRLKMLTNENLNRTDSLFRVNLSQIDTLRQVYMNVMLEEAKKQTTGTNIDLGGDKNTTKELDLFETNREINASLKNIATEKSRKYEIINVISNFQPIGAKLEGIKNNFIFLLATLCPVLMIFYLLLAQLNSYLLSYKKD